MKLSIRTIGWLLSLIATLSTWCILSRFMQKTHGKIYAIRSSNQTAIIIDRKIISIANNTNENFSTTPIDQSMKIRGQSVTQQSKIYVVNAYQISNNCLRLILISACGLEKSSIEAQYDADGRNYTIKSETIISIRETCPAQYYVACTFVAHLAEFQLPSGNSHINKIILRRSSGSLGGLSVPVTHVLSSNSRQHFLAVCVKPLYYFNDWIQLVQFMESWLINAATKYYIYWRSISREVQRIIELYQVDGIDIKMIEWPSTKDADTKLYLSGQIESINDCLLSARTEAEFVAVVDFDELVFMPQQSLVNYLKRLGINKSGISLMSKELKTKGYILSSGNPFFALDDNCERGRFQFRMVPKLYGSGFIIIARAL